jgi:hypothetical protein
MKSGEVADEQLRADQQEDAAEELTSTHFPHQAISGSA